MWESSFACCPSDCLFVCLFVSEHDTGHNFGSSIMILCIDNLHGIRKKPIENGVRAPKGKGSKVTKFNFPSIFNVNSTTYISMVMIDIRLQFSRYSSPIPQL